MRMIRIHREFRLSIPVSFVHDGNMLAYTSVPSWAVANSGFPPEITHRPFFFLKLRICPAVRPLRSGDILAQLFQIRIQI